MKKIVFIFILVLISLTAFRCEGAYRFSEDCHTRIKFNNTSEKSLYLAYEGIYPDTIAGQTPDPTLDPNFNKVSPGEVNTEASFNFDCYEDDFRSRWIKSDTLVVYVFDAAVLENTPWEEVKSRYLILKRYDLSEQDLRKLGWTVSYPPTEAMKDMKMYPPYGK